MILVCDAVLESEIFGGEGFATPPTPDRGEVWSGSGTGRGCKISKKKWVGVVKNLSLLGNATPTPRGVGVLELCIRDLCNTRCMFKDQGSSKT